MSEQNDKSRRTINNPNKEVGIPTETSGQKNLNGEKKLLKFLFISLESLSGDLAWTIKKEGHEVKIYIKSKGDTDVYGGFVERVERYEDFIDWADVIIFDDVEFGPLAEKLRKRGKFVIGGSEYTDRLEMDREFGQMEMKKYGVNTLPHWQYNNYDEAINFIKNNPDRYVFKPSGNTPSSGKGLLFIGQDEDGKDIIELLEQNKNVWLKKAPVFQLQKYVNGIEIAVGAFFNGKDFIFPININFEHKRIFPGDIGPLTGEMGTLMFWSETNIFFKSTLEKMLPALRVSGYIGYIDINCVANGRGIYPLEFTCRFGYPTIQIQQEGISMLNAEWLYKLAHGENFELKTKRGFQIGVRILVPTYFVKSKDKEIVEMYRDLPILFKKSGNVDGLHIEDVKIENGVWRIAGESGVLMTVTGSGTTVDEAQRQAYSRVQNVRVQNMFYRTDIGSKWAEDSDKLHAWGYLY